jgi:predicted amidohydrolase/ribosomal protein S18 acetylase RimI-like enzyme
MENHKAEPKIVIRNFLLSDFEDLKENMRTAYPTIDDDWEKSDIKRLLKVFPEGQICVEVDDKVIACAFSIIVDYDQFGDQHTYIEITDNGRFSTHNANGDVLYGIEILVHPDYQGMRLGRRLYDGRKEICENLNLKSIIAGGRIPGYKEFRDELSPRQYIEKVKEREIHDPILNFQLSNDFHVRKILKNYLPEDSDSEAFATLLEWNNIYYEKNEKLLNKQRKVIRIGLVQWQMRTLKGFDELIEQMEFFIAAVSDYQSDFILFPELFNAPLMAEFNQQSTPDAIRSLAGYTEDIRKKFTEFAVAYNINIVAGSMPIYEDEKLYNGCYLCRRDGTVELQKKIHVTPDDNSYWGTLGGNEVKTFDTDCGKIGILICYDSEFPELSRLLAQEEMNILFVPFLTDTPNGYHRIRHCAQARAIENECYVAIAGCVGNLPRVHNMDIQYAQSAVFSPCDFSFPTNGVVAEATPNSEMTLIADVDLNLLKELHLHGSVRNLIDRRTDLFELKWKN